MTTTTTTTTTTSRDAFGSRVGTQSNMINRVLLAAKKMLTVAEVSERTGLSNKRCRNHLEWLAARNLISY